MGFVRALIFPILIGVLMIGCVSAPTSSPGRSSSAAQPGGSAGSSSGKTMVMALRHNVPDLSYKIPGPGGQDIIKRIWNASLVLVDATGTPRPYLAETLPELGTESWVVQPDGTMETTYKLKANLTWHDGQPLTAQDFVFAWQVYLHPSLITFETKPENLMESVTAPDARTIAIRWRAPYPDANALASGALDPLPRHILEAPFAVVQGDPAGAEAFTNLRYWNSEYIGAGPFKLERWEPSVEWEGSAFVGHALGRPKIDRIIVRLIPDTNTVMANVLGGEIHFSPDFTLQFEHGQILQRDWVPANRGAVIFKTGVASAMEVQQRPEFVGHPSLLDVRVRRAMAHAVNRESINEGVFEGRGVITEHIVPPSAPFFAEVDRVVMKYPLDPRRTEQLMNEAGFTKDREGIFADASGQRFRTELRYSAGPEWERRTAILSDGYRTAGIQADPYPLPAEAGRNREVRAQFPGFASRGGGMSEMNFTGDEVAGPSNRWGGSNRSGWANPEYDRVYQTFGTTLNRSERIQHFTTMQRLLTEHLPVFTFHFYVEVNAHVADLIGPANEVPPIGTVSLAPTQHWNIHEWHWR